MSENTPGTVVDDGGYDEIPMKVSFIRHDTMDKSTKQPPVAIQLIGGTRPSQTSEPSVSGSSGGGALSSSYRDHQRFLLDDNNDFSHWNRMHDSLVDDDDDDDANAFAFHPAAPLGVCVAPAMAVNSQQPLNNNELFADDDEDALAPFPRVSSSQILYETKRKPPKMVGNYLIGDQLGEGSYGKVKEALDCRNLCRRAVKILKERRLRKIINGEQDVQREIRLLRRLNHRNVIRLFDVLKNDVKRKLYLFIEYCVGSLQEMLDSAPGKKFPVWQSHAYFVQLLEGLEYLHGACVVHKDVKPGNLLLTTDETLKITDFGVAEELDRYSGDDSCTSGRGTPKFQPPEIASGQSKFRGFPVDVWASGVTLYNLVSGLYPYEGENVYKLYDNISKNEAPTPPDVDATLADLLRGMLRKNVDERLTLQKVRTHVWCTKKHPITLDRVPPPAYRGDPTRHMTVYGYLEQMYGPRSSTSSVAPVDSPPCGQLTILSDRGGGAVLANEALKFGGSEPDTLNKSPPHPELVGAAVSSTINRKRFHPFQASVKKSSSEPRTNKLTGGGAKPKSKASFCKIQ